MKSKFKTLNARFPAHRLQLYICGICIAKQLPTNYQIGKFWLTKLHRELPAGSALAFGSENWELQQASNTLTLFYSGLCIRKYNNCYSANATRIQDEHRTQSPYVN